MKQTIKIKPNDQSLVGKQFKNSYNVLVRVIAVEGEKVFFKYEEWGNSENSFNIDSFNKIYSLVEEPQQKAMEHSNNSESIDTKKKLLAPAFYKPKHELEWRFSKDSGSYYSSKEDAQKHFGDDHEVIWPAIPNKDGWYEIDTEAKDCKKSKREILKVIEHLINKDELPQVSSSFSKMNNFYERGR